MRINSLLLSLLCFFIFSCSKKQEGTVTSKMYVVSGFEALFSTIANNGLIIYGKTNDGKSFTKKVATDTITLDLPAGTWNFYAVAWEVVNPAANNPAYTGKTHCGKLENVLLSDESALISIDVSNASCNDSVFSPFIKTDTTPETRLPTVEVYTCQSLSSISSFSDLASCTGTDSNRGHGTYFKIKVWDTINSDGASPVKSSPLVSACYEFSTPLGELRLPSNLPFGSASIEVYYSQTPCDSSYGVEEFPFTLSNGVRWKVFANANGAASNPAILRYFYNTRADKLYNPRNFQVSSAGEVGITFDWMSGGPLVAGYRIATQAGSTAPSDCSSGEDVTSLSHAIVGLVPNTTYSFRICSYDTSGNLSKGYVITTATSPDTTIPSIVSVSTSTGTYGVGNSLIVTMAFSEPVQITGQPTIVISSGSYNYLAEAAPSALSLTHSFTYDVKAGDYAQISTLSLSAISLNAGTIKDSAGNDLSSLSFGPSTLSNVAVYGCPPEWVPVPANPSVGVNTNFCVMKFEAKNVSTIAQSAPTGLPWVSISAANAKTKCQSLGAQFDLISNPEWMAIARNVEGVDFNWSNTSVGSGFLYKGHSDAAPSSVLAVTSIGDSYSDTGNTAGSNQRRTMQLSNDLTIWDFSGNAYEWVDWDPNAVGFTPGPTNCGASWNELPGCLTSNDASPSGAYSSSFGIGMIYGGMGGAARRGGNYSVGAVNTGIYSLNLNSADNVTYAETGFRCVLRPPP